MTITNILTIIGTFVGTIVTVLTLAWKYSQAHDAKVSRVYKRMDEIKDQNKKDFVSKEVCDVMHRQMREDIREIKTDVKLLLKKNGFKE